MINTMAADDLGMQGAWASVAMVLAPEQNDLQCADDVLK